MEFNFKINGQHETHIGTATVLSTPDRTVLKEAKAAHETDQVTIRKIGTAYNGFDKTIYDVYETYVDSAGDYHYFATNFSQN